MKQLKLARWQNKWIIEFCMLKDMMEQWFLQKARFDDCDFLRVELMKTMMMEDKYKKGIKIDTLFWPRQVLW
jgi:hypothetical protein